MSKDRSYSHPLDQAEYDEAREEGVKAGREGNSVSDSLEDFTSGYVDSPHAHGLEDGYEEGKSQRDK